jgi:hypothetical protein
MVSETFKQNYHPNLVKEQAKRYDIAITGSVIIEEAKRVRANFIIDYFCRANGNTNLR